MFSYREALDEQRRMVEFRENHYYGRKNAVPSDKKSGGIQGELNGTMHHTHIHKK